MSYVPVQHFNLIRGFFFHVIISTCSWLKVDTSIFHFKSDNAVVFTKGQRYVHLVITYLSISFLSSKIEGTWSVFWTWQNVANWKKLENIVRLFNILLYWNGLSTAMFFISGWKPSCCMTFDDPCFDFCGFALRKYNYISDMDLFKWGNL